MLGFEQKRDPSHPGAPPAAWRGKAERETQAIPRLRTLPFSNLVPGCPGLQVLQIRALAVLPSAEILLPSLTEHLLHAGPWLEAGRVGRDARGSWVG